MINLKVLTTVFITVFLSELGDKTQLATLLFATTNRERLSVFIGSSLALIVASALAVLLGDFISKNVNITTVKNIAGIGFIIIGIWILINNK